MKYHIEKNTVQETLVIPLLGRLVCSEHFPELFSDPERIRRNTRKRLSSLSGGLYEQKDVGSLCTDI